MSEEAEADKAAARLLSHRALPEIKLRQKLLERGFSEEVVNSVVERFTQKGYLNDRDWAEGAVRGCQRKGQGAHRIRAFLRSHRIAEAVIEEVLPQEDEEEKRLAALLENRYHSRDLSLPSERQKVAASLYRKGFSPDAIWRAIKEESSS